MKLSDVMSKLAGEKTYRGLIDRIVLLGATLVFLIGNWSFRELYRVHLEKFTALSADIKTLQESVSSVRLSVTESKGDLKVVQTSLEDIKSRQLLNTQAIRELDNRLDNDHKRGP